MSDHRDRDEPNRNQVEGRVDQASGAVKEVAGEKSGDVDLEQAGELDQVAGKAQENLGDKQADGEISE